MSDIESYEDDKSKWLGEFNHDRPDLFFPEQWSDEKKAKAVEEIRPSRIKSGLLSSVPQTCRGDRCPLSQWCPLLKKNLAPVGEKCPIESAMSIQFFNDYVRDLGVDTDRMVEVSLVADIVDQEIQQFRKRIVLGDEHFIQENVIGIDSEGKVITRKELHQAIEYEDKIHRRKEKLLKALMATREAQAKVGQGNVDTAVAISNLMEQFKEYEDTKEKILRKRLGMAESDKDMYIEDAEIVEEDD